jgi:hypothetical protein
MTAFAASRTTHIGLRSLLLVGIAERRPMAAVRLEAPGRDARALSPFGAALAFIPLA